MNPTKRKQKPHDCGSVRPLKKDMKTKVCNCSIKSFLKCRIEELQSVVDDIRTMDDDDIHQILASTILTAQHIANRLDTKMHVEIGMSKDWSDRKTEPDESPPF